MYERTVVTECNRQIGFLSTMRKRYISKAQVKVAAYDQKLAALIEIREAELRETEKA